MKSERCHDCNRPAELLLVVATEPGVRELRCADHAPKRDYDPRHR